MSDFVLRTILVNPFDGGEYFEVNAGPFITEQAGYVSTKDMVSGMLQSGRMLDSFRNGDYDFDEESDPDEAVSDPTRSPNFDVVDAQRLAERLKRRVRLAKSDPSDKSSVDPSKSVSGVPPVPAPAVPGAPAAPAPAMAPAPSAGTSPAV
jgi:hypothetical protein